MNILLKSNLQIFFLSKFLVYIFWNLQNNRNNFYIYISAFTDYFFHSFLCLFFYIEDSFFCILKSYFLKYIKKAYSVPRISQLFIVNSTQFRVLAHVSLLLRTPKVSWYFQQSRTIGKFLEQTYFNLNFSK